MDCISLPRTKLLNKILDRSLKNLVARWSLKMKLYTGGNIFVRKHAGLLTTLYNLYTVNGFPDYTLKFMCGLPFVFTPRRDPNHIMFTCAISPEDVLINSHIIYASVNICMATFYITMFPPPALCYYFLILKQVIHRQFLAAQQKIIHIAFRENKYNQ